MMGFEITNEEFDQIRALVQGAVGIQLNDTKRALIVSRLGKRLRVLGYETFREYCAHLRHRDPDGREMREMINAITTNKTEFFREAHHFDWLRDVLVEEARRRAQTTGVRKLRIWSAGCSTGQEPYSIAMVVADALGITGWDVRILASDIDTQVLARAQAGEYSEDDAADVPEPRRSRYFERTSQGVIVARALRDLVTFRRVNLIDRSWPIRARFDAIFCRNVTIYFDRSTQEALYQRFVRQLEPHGYVVAGHSENLHWMSRLLTPVGGTVYRLATGAPHGSLRPIVKHLSLRPSMPPGARPGPRVPSRRPPPLEDVPIQSGGLHVAARPTLVRTVLGSCVAACIHDPVAAVGGMNHFMLPDGCDSDWVPTRFGRHAMEALLRGVLEAGGQRARLRAKVFGGAHVLRGSLRSNEIPDGNVRFVRQFLSDAGVPIRAEKVGGELPMMIRFETHTGRVLLRMVEGSEAGDVVERDARYLRDLNASARQSERELAAAWRTA